MTQQVAILAYIYFVFIGAFWQEALAVEEDITDVSCLLQTFRKDTLSTIAAQSAPKRQSAEKYYWATGRGPVTSYGVSPYPVKLDVSAHPTWTWRSKKGYWSNIPNGIALDDQENLYLTLADGITKFNADGQILWEYKRPSEDEEISTAAAISNGAAYTITSKARAFAISMETGDVIWSKIVGSGNDGNNAQVSAHDGIVLASTNAVGHRSNSEVVALNSTDGSHLWSYKPDITIWNFAPSLVGDGTFVFQDLEGRAHRNNLTDGKNVWKSGGVPGSWTDGHSTVGPNGVVYSVSNYNHWNPGGQPDGFFSKKGKISAFNLSDGKLLWQRNTSWAPNQVPVVGQLAGQSRLSVVLPGGQQGAQGEAIYVSAFDAENGTIQWTFTGPTLMTPLVPGDREPEAQLQRTLNRVRTITLPNPWGQGAIDSNGIFYCGAQSGQFLSFVDANNDGIVEYGNNMEVSSYENGAAFVGSMSPAIAPGMLAVGDLAGLYVWKWPQ